MTMIVKPAREVADFKGEDVEYVTAFRMLCRGRSKNEVLRSLIKLFTNDKGIQEKIFRYLDNGDINAIHCA